MSYAEDTEQVAVPQENLRVELPVPLEQFAAALRPRPGVVNGRPALLPGEPDEVFLKLMRIRFRGERHTPTEWQALLDSLRHEPAHPLHPRYPGA